MIPPDTPEDLDVLSVDAETGVSVLFERGPLLSLQLLTSDPDRFKDILVPEGGMALIHAHCGWEYAPGTEAFSVVAIDVSGKPVATAEAAPIRSRGQQGMNVSYAVAAGWEGRGLAKLCAAYAILGIGGNTGAGVVNVHLRSGNAASARVAEQLGLVRTPQADFAAPVRAVLTAFETCQGDYRDVARRCLTFLVQRGAFDQAMRDAQRPGG